MSLWQKVKASFQKWNWKNVDYDGVYANQCVDWVRQYSVDIGCLITTFGNARWFATIWLWPNWRKLDKWEEPWIWDVIVQPRGTYWHIAIVHDYTPDTVYVMEQNRNARAYKNNDKRNLWTSVSLWKYPILGDEVYFRPIPKAKKKTPAPNPIKNGKRTNSKSG